MDSELVTGSESETGRNGTRYSSLSTSYAEYFEELCPYYIHAGMTYDQFWNQDCTMVKAYRKAYDMKQEDDNFKLWLQGRYIYDALCAVAPIVRAFSKARKPADYVSEPYMLKTEYSKYRERQKQAESTNKARAFMESFAVEFNRRFEEKKGG